MPHVARGRGSVCTACSQLTDHYYQQSQPTCEWPPRHRSHVTASAPATSETAKVRLPLSTRPLILLAGAPSPLISARLRISHRSCPRNPSHGQSIPVSRGTGEGVHGLCRTTRQNAPTFRTRLPTANKTSSRAVTSPPPRVPDVTPMSDDEHHLAGILRENTTLGLILVDPRQSQT